MTKQEIFTKVTLHLLKQNNRSMLGDGSDCAYRGDNGSKCAVGCLIPDELYSVNMEKWSIRKLIECSEERKILHEIPGDLVNFLRKELGNDVAFLQELQRIHDNNHPGRWHQLLKDFAQENELIFPVIP